MKTQFVKGLKDGIPIALGYLSVSFGFGIMAVGLGLSVFEAFAISALNLTSAGQVAGVKIIAASGTYIEMVLTQLVINIRYSLMGLSLSQKLDNSFRTPQRLIASFGITDEVFAVSYSQPGKITPIYMYGLILISFFGWTGGTLFGAVAGQVLPTAVIDAMGIVLYGMFIAIIIPAAKESTGVLVTIAAAACISTVFYYQITFLSSGFSIIISAVAASAICAALFPITDTVEEDE